MLIKIILVAIAACGAATIIILHDAPTQNPAPPAPTAPAVLRPATAQERQVLRSLVTVAPKNMGGMH
jgi:hypothetical protein